MFTTLPKQHKFIFLRLLVHSHLYRCLCM